MNTPDTSVLVVGGGIGGMATALAVARTGRPVHLVEQASQFAEIGAGLQVGPNAVRALDRLDLLNDVLTSAVKPRAGMFMDGVSGEPLTTVDFGPSFVQRYGYPYLVVHRHDLLDAMLAACRDEIHLTMSTGRRAVDVQDDGTHATVTFADGDRLTAEVVVGADGVWSAMRSFIDTQQPVCSGHVAYRGTVPVTSIDADTDNVLLWIGPGFHLMQYPVRRGKLYNQVAVIESEAFKRGAGDWGGPDELAERFVTACDAVRASVSRIPTDRRWPVWDRDPSDSWSKGRVVLVGDAAHAMLQYLGQGACQALEDALSLAENLDTYGLDHRKAFASYEEARVARASLCQTVARPWGDLWHTTDPVLLALRNRYFRVRQPDDYSDLDWLYAADS